MTILGTVTFNGQKRNLTSDDYRWALISTLGEAGGDPSHSYEWGAVLYTMLNRWLGRYGRGGESSFGSYIQKFSQPVNPNQIGKIHDYDKTDDDPTGTRHSAERDARIRNNLTRPLGPIEQAHPELASYVKKFLKGQIPREPYKLFADFAAPKVRSSKQRIQTPVSTANAFYTEEWVKDLLVQMMGKKPTIFYLGVLAVALSVGISAWLYLRRH